MAKERYGKNPMSIIGGSKLWITKNSVLSELV
jgi:hypothetical protein